MRRGGARHEVSERVNLLGPNFKTRDGWALNVSRGGVRVILEETNLWMPFGVHPDTDLAIGDESRDRGAGKVAARAVPLIAGIVRQ